MISLTATATLVCLALGVGFILGGLVALTLKSLEDHEARDREAVGARGEVEGAAVHALENDR